MPKVSVVIAAYNHERFVRELIESILAQTYEDFEVIAVDDGSSDRTPEILEEYVPRIRVIRQANQGVVRARMRGFDESSGEYVCFIDSDDRITPDRMERQVPVLDQDPNVGLVYGDAKIIDEAGKELGLFSDLYRPIPNASARDLFARYCFVPATTVTFRRSSFLATGPLWGPGPICDYLKWIEIALASRMVRIPRVLASWRRHPASVSLSVDCEGNYLGTLAALKELRRRWPELHRQTRWCAPKRYSQIFSMIGFFAGVEKDYPKARRYFLRAIRQWPLMARNYLFLAFSAFPLRNLAPEFFRRVHEFIYKWK